MTRFSNHESWNMENSSLNFFKAYDLIIDIVNVLKHHKQIISFKMRRKSNNSFYSFKDKFDIFHFQ